jgi:hypothetical protein
MTDSALKPVKNGHRFSSFTVGTGPFYSRFRPYKSPFPTVGMIALGNGEGKNVLTLLSPTKPPSSPSPTIEEKMN